MTHSKQSGMPKSVSAQSDNLPGLVTEAETMETLIEKLKIIIPEPP